MKYSYRLSQFFHNNIHTVVIYVVYIHLFVNYWTMTNLTLSNPVYCILFICQIVPPGLLSTSTSICMSKAAESLRSNQPQWHRLSAQCLPRAAEASSSAFGGSESKSLYRSPMGGEESSYSNSVENASTHRGTVTHSWDNKYHSETHDPSANWDQSMNLVPIHDCHQADSPRKANESLSPCFRMAIWKSESVCHVIQDGVYRTTEENGWGETVWAYEMHLLGRQGSNETRFK